MSGSSPDDLSIAFRSVTRRWREAQGDAPDHLVADPRGALDSALARAAALLGCDAAPESIAEAIHRRSASEWTDESLDQLRAIALEIGALLRTASNLADQG